jgi:hypothetical protein
MKHGPESPDHVAYESFTRDGFYDLRRTKSGEPRGFLYTTYYREIAPDEQRFFSQFTDLLLKKEKEKKTKAKGKKRKKKREGT